MIIITKSQLSKYYICSENKKVVVKQVVTIALIFAIFGQSIGKLVLLANYLLNKESITLIFCENKSKPKLKCNGKCHLNKQLKEQEKQENSSKSNTKNVDEVQFFSEYDYTILPRFIYISNLPNWAYLNKETNNASPSVFHPPTV